MKENYLFNFFILNSISFLFYYNKIILFFNLSSILFVINLKFKNICVKGILILIFIVEILLFLKFDIILWFILVIKCFILIVELTFLSSQKIKKYKYLDFKIYKNFYKFREKYKKIINSGLIENSCLKNKILNFIKNPFITNEFLSKILIYNVFLKQDEEFYEILRKRGIDERILLNNQKMNHN